MQTDENNIGTKKDKDTSGRLTEPYLENKHIYINTKYIFFFTKENE